MAVSAVLTATLLVALPTAAYGEPKPAGERAALTKARESGERVEVTSERDERTQLFVEPDGSFTVEQYSQPVRVRAEDGWEPVDTTLVRAGETGIRPKAAAAEVEFSAGGNGAPMAAIGLGSKGVSLDWPGTLPEPELDGDQATYVDVLPGVDLVLTAGVDGFSQVLVVKDAEAAQNPDLAEFELALETRGVEMRQDADGNLEAVGRAGGRGVFIASAPMMWDSGGEDLTAKGKTLAPAAGARVEPVDADLEPDSIRLVPDAAMLADESTRFPVFIDPSVSVTRQAWAYVDKRFPSTAYYNRSDKDTGVGYEPQFGHTKRAFFRFSVFERTKKSTTVIESATLRAEVDHAFGCTDAKFSLYQTSAISSKTTWNNQPSKIELQQTVNVDHGRPACGGSGVEFNASEAYKWGASGNKASLTLGLFGNESASGSNWDWRRFEKNPKLVVKYNNKPATPATSKMSDSHGGVCATDPAKPRLMNTTAPTLRAQVRDYDSYYGGQKVKARFEWRFGVAGEREGYADSTSADVATWPSGSFRTAKAGGLPEHTLIGYRAIAHDTQHWSEWSGWCYLRIDTTNPETGPDVDSEDYPAGDVATDGVGKPGRFTFAANGVDDAAAYHYSVNDASCATKLTPTTPGGSATTSIYPRHDGPNLIHARTTDAHGNSSACVLVYTFTVKPPAGPVAHLSFDEGEGTSAADSADPSRVATASGAAEWTRGRIGHMDAGTYRRNGTAADLDGSGGRFSTEGSAVDTGDGYSVAAWVRLDTASGNRTVLSQDGNVNSAFMLGYQSTFGLDNWVFKIPAADAEGASGWARAVSDAPAQTGVWTHLLGTFDPGTGTARLFVDGVEQQTAGTHGAPWNGTGGLVVGGAKFDGATSDAWNGAIDDVKVWDRIVIGEQPAESESRPETWALANQPAALDGRWELDETSGTEVEDTSDHGLDGTLHGDPATAWNTALNDVTFSPGVTLNGTDERITTGTPAVRTDRSFSVAAWVRLDEVGTNATAVSQDGVQHSGFYLGHQNTADWDQWVLKMPPSDEQGASGWHRAVSEGAPELGAWVHLAATYDHTTGELTLYVDGTRQGVDTQTSPWNADRALVIGAARFEEQLDGAWNGDIDDVHIYQGVLGETDVARVRAGDLPTE